VINALHVLVFIHSNIHPFYTVFIEPNNPCCCPCPTHTQTVLPLQPRW